MKNQTTKKQSKIQGSAEVLVAKKVKNITKRTITFPQLIFYFVQSVKTLFYSAVSIIYISPSDPKTIFLCHTPSSLIQVSFPVSVRLFSFFFSWSLVLTSLCTLPRQPQRSMNGLNITGLKGEKFDGRKWWQMEEEEEERWVFTVTVRVQRSSYNHICCHYEHSL